ncbi:hypothetical protein HY837_03995, partial [archaeon]|nr:hypothetical protein [archaeon]
RGFEQGEDGDRYPDICASLQGTALIPKPKKLHNPEITEEDKNGNT